MPKHERALSVLFLCTGNSCRSQMAEGWTRHLHNHLVVPYSAGVKPGRLDPNAVRVMAEVGIEIGGQLPKHIDELTSIDFDCVVTVCDNARASCPVYPAHTLVIHRAFDDPPHVAQHAQTDDERIAVYRRVRDEIREFVATLSQLIAAGEATSMYSPNKGLLPS